MEKTQAFIQSNKKVFLDQLFELLRIPSISADSQYKEDIRKTAEKVKTLLLEAGVDRAELLETPGNPIVYAEKMMDPTLPTILVYGHYDVQPVVPLELWDTNPFEPIIKKTKIHPDGAIFARGSTDDKGQMFMHIAAFQAMHKSAELKANVKFVIEGEEEVGSANLKDTLIKYKEKFKADVVLISDSSIFSHENPSICVGLRGIAAVEVEITGPKRDLHSGVYGGAIANPIQILCKMIDALKDENNHITIPHFYDHVLEFSAQERKKVLDAVPFDETDYKKDLDIEATLGEKGYHILEQTSIRPTLELNGIWGGYQGEGSKTIVPSKASAKITMRMVQGQDPDFILREFEKYFNSLAPKGVRVKITKGHTAKAYFLPSEHKAYLAAEKAMEKTFGKKPFAKKDGGSIPITTLFEDVLGIKSVLLGFGLDSDALHSPNEHFGLWNFYKGIETIPYFYEYYTAGK